MYEELADLDFGEPFQLEVRLDRIGNSKIVCYFRYNGEWMFEFDVTNIPTDLELTVTKITAHLSTKLFFAGFIPQGITNSL